MQGEEEKGNAIEDVTVDEFLRGFMVRFLCMPHIVRSLFKNFKNLEDIAKLIQKGRLRCCFRLYFYRKCGPQNGWECIVQPFSDETLLIHWNELECDDKRYILSSFERDLFKNLERDALGNWIWMSAFSHDSYLQNLWIDSGRLLVCIVMCILWKVSSSLPIAPSLELELGLNNGEEESWKEITLHFNALVPTTSTGIKWSRDDIECRYMKLLSDLYFATPILLGKFIPAGMEED